MDRTNLEVAWKIDAPSLGFAERVVMTASGEGFEVLDRASGMVPILFKHGPPSGIMALRRAFATGVVTAAAAAVLCLFGPSTGEVNLRSAASGGKAATNPDAINSSTRAAIVERARPVRSASSDLVRPPPSRRS